jgi:ABC-type multidrug transport system fused ATPase/permease subunit
MFVLSWQLSLLAFISVPVITMLSKVYGEYVRKLTKLMQKKLADGNSTAEAAIGSMATVRAFDAGESELIEFEASLKKYLS